MYYVCFYLSTVIIDTNTIIININNKHSINIDS